MSWIRRYWVEIAVTLAIVVVATGAVVDIYSLFNRNSLAAACIDRGGVPVKVEGYNIACFDPKVMR